VTLKVDLSDFKRFGKELSILRERELPHAVKDTLNSTAFEARKAWTGEMRKQLTLRNKFTENSARVEKARGTKIRDMRATLGSVAHYMDDAEEGAKQTGSGHVGYPVPTGAAAGQPKANKRTRPIRRANFLAAIKLAERDSTGSTRQQRNAITIRKARKAGKTFVYMETSKKKGIFRLDGLKRGLRVRMMYDLSKKTTQAKPKPTLHAAVRAVSPRIPILGRRAILRQLTGRVMGFRRAKS
jgi:hypothetical protein